MAQIVADRIKETTTTTGTGTIDLAGAVTGFRTFNDVMATGDTCYYAIVGRAGIASEWEVGLGTFTDATPDTLARTAIRASSNAGAAVDFSAGTKDVFITLTGPDDVVIFHGFGDDSTDDGPALQVALDAAAGRTIRLVPGLTYRVATAIVTRGKAWTLDARGAKIHVDADIEALTAYADIDNLQSVSAISGADVTVANGAAFAVGDHVRVISEDVPTNARSVPLPSGNVYKSGEPGIVASIAGDVLTLANVLVHGAEMVTTRRIFRMPLEEQVRIIGGEWYYTEGHDATPWTSDMIRLYGLISPRVEGVRITRGYGGGLVTVGTQNAYISGVHAERLADNSGNSQFGYGISDGGYNTKVIGLSGEKCRHLLTTNPLALTASATTSEDDLHKYGHCRGLRLIGGTYMGGSSTAFDTHHMTEDVLFSDLFAQNCPTVVNVRAQGARISNVRGRNISDIMVQAFSESLGSGGPATEAGWASDINFDNITGDTAKVVRVIRATDIHIGRINATTTRWRAIEVDDGDVYLHDDIDLTIVDTVTTDAGFGIISADDDDATFGVRVEQRSGRIKVRGEDSSGSTSYAAVRADGSTVIVRDMDVTFPTSSVGPMLVTANSGTIEFEGEYDIDGSGESAMVLTSGSNILANIESLDGSSDLHTLTLGTWNVLAASGVAVSHTGNTNETALATIQVPANAMGANGAIRVTTTFSYTNSGNNKTQRVRFGGAAGTQYFLVVDTATASRRHQTQIHNRNATNSQVGQSQSVAFGSSGVAATTSAVDTTAAVDIVISGQLANSGETITLENHTVEIFKAA